MTVVDDRARDPDPGRDDALDPVALARRANGETRWCLLAAGTLDDWLDDSGLAQRGDDGRLRLTREAWSLAGRAFG